jgi:heme-degrading monooxygenase HmoA
LLNRTACAARGIQVDGGPFVILEVAPLRIRAGQAQAFERSFREAQEIIRATPGYISHELQRCIERPNEYVFLVRWESVDAHEVGFRGSPQYQQWKALLHHYYDPFPTVLHFEAVAGATSV